MCFLKAGANDKKKSYIKSYHFYWQKYVVHDLEFEIEANNIMKSKTHIKNKSYLLKSPRET